jgi:transcriptional regulator with GAF, ATPase, and Fis domain
MVRVDFPALPAIILAIAQQRSLSAVLDAIIDSVARQSDVALARIWLLQSDADCSHCSPAGLSTPTEALHLRASRGTPLNGDADWSRTTGAFHRVPLGRSDLKLSHMATTGESVRIVSLEQDRKWVRHPEWVQTQQLAGFAGHPIVFRGAILGVLAVFTRTEPGDACWEWLRALSDAAAVAIANARAFEEVETLRHELEMERDYLRQEVREEGAFGEILGRSSALNRLVTQVEMVAPTDANVLIEGESGSGKELVARAVHQRSLRTHKSMVKVNCGSIPRELFESEFFGHARGSFTGAIRDRVGRFQLADGGTLFLDEVGEIPIELQSKLLRVLQEGEFERVGDEATRRVNVRVIAATNRDLRREVAEGRFRLDLYYRLGVFPIAVPPLRDRLEDIPELAAHFVRHACMRFHVAEPKLPQRELERARRYNWPGNVRELQNVVERAVILASGGTMSLELPQLPNRPAPTPRQTLDIIPEAKWRDREKQNLLAAMERANYKISGKDGAAELLGINPATLTSRLKVLGIHKRPAP